MKNQLLVIILILSFSLVSCGDNNKDQQQLTLKQLQQKLYSETITQEEYKQLQQKRKVIYQEALILIDQEKWKQAQEKLDITLPVEDSTQLLKYVNARLKIENNYDYYGAKYYLDQIPDYYEGKYSTIILAFKDNVNRTCNNLDQENQYQPQLSKELELVNCNADYSNDKIIITGSVRNNLKIPVKNIEMRVSFYKDNKQELIKHEFFFVSFGKSLNPGKLVDFNKEFKGIFNVEGIEWEIMDYAKVK